MQLGFHTAAATVFLDVSSYQISLGARVMAAGMLTVDFLQVLPRLGGTDIPDFSLWWVPPALLAIYAGSLLADAESAVDIHGAE